MTKPTLNDVRITEYLVQASRKPITLRYHTTKDKEGWGIWWGKALMLSPEGRWSYPDRRAIPSRYLFNTAEEALEHWYKYRKLGEWE